MDPLTINVPGLGEALAVFCFEEEAKLYLGYEDDLRPRPVGPDELMVLLLGCWSRFELVTLDPMPENGTGEIVRPASVHRDDFLNYLVSRCGLGQRTFAGHTRSDPGVVGGPPAPG